MQPLFLRPLPALITSPRARPGAIWLLYFVFEYASRSAETMQTKRVMSIACDGNENKRAFILTPTKIKA